MTFKHVLLQTHNSFCSYTLSSREIKRHIAENPPLEAKELADSQYEEICLLMAAFTSAECGLQAELQKQ